MGLGSWAKKHLAVRLDSHTLGNFLKNASPAAGLIGGPAGIALAGGLSAAGDVARGKDVSLGNAITNASLAAGVGGLKNALTKAPTVAAPPTAPGAVAHSGVALPSVPDLTTAATKAVDPRSFAGHALDAGKGVLSFAEQHPQTAAAGLTAIGNLSTAGAQNRVANAQADLLEQQAGETAYDFEQRKRRSEALAPTWSALGTAIGGGYGHVAANPYLPTGG